MIVVNSFFGKLQPKVVIWIPVTLKSSPKTPLSPLSSRSYYFPFTSLLKTLTLWAIDQDIVQKLLDGKIISLLSQTLLTKNDFNSFLKGWIFKVFEHYFDPWPTVWWPESYQNLIWSRLLNVRTCACGLTLPTAGVLWFFFLSPFPVFLYEILHYHVPKSQLMPFRLDQNRSFGVAGGRNQP